MRLGIYHGYELTGSGSNEYTRYLSRALARLGHEVHVFCREPDPMAVVHLSAAYEADGTPILERDGIEGTCVMHRLPRGEVHPVYLTDKQRSGNVKAFPRLSDAELDAYHDHSVASLRRVLDRIGRLDVLHANHLVYQPVVAAELGVPFVVYPHGSSIEYTLREDARLRERALGALRKAKGLISGSREMLSRIRSLYPGEEFPAEIVGVGVDTDLFRPMPRDAWRVLDRTRYGGKPQEQCEELRRRLDRGEFDAVTRYREAYDHSQPDAAFGAKVERVDWHGGRVLLFVGALAAGKGLHNLIAALPAVPGAHLLIVGSGAYREVLEALVHAIATGNQELFDFLRRNGFDLDRSGLAGPWKTMQAGVPREPGFHRRVHFLGRLNHDQLRYVFPCADLAVFPSVVPEAYPLVLMESLANGVLPVVSDFSGFRDGLDALEPLLGRETVDLMRLPLGAGGGIARRLNALLEAERPTGLREIAVEHFDWSVIARRMVSAYEALLRASR